MSDEALTARLKGYLERRPRLGPETVHLDVANACNLRCVTCWSHAALLSRPKSAAWKAQRIDPGLFQRVVGEAAALGATRIIVGGAGEPFTHPEIVPMLASVKARARGLRLTLLTNGTRCDFADLVRLGVDQVLLNLASATARTYAAYHPGEPEETFHRVLEGARALAGKLNLVQVINRVNADEVPGMVDLAARLGARSSFKLGDTPPGTERFGLSATDRARLLHTLVPEARRRAKALGVRHNLDSFAAQLGQGPGASEPECFAGYLYARVWVDGTAFFCCEHAPVADLARVSFAEAWGSPSWTAMRERLHRGERLPGCVRCGKHDLNYAAAQALRRLRAEGTLP